MGAPKALDKFQKHKLPLNELFSLWANYFNKLYLLLNILICTSPFIISPTILKTGLLSLKSSCLIFTMGFLQYKKNRITKIIFITPGMIKYKLIENTLINSIILTIGPSTASVRTNINILSRIPKSFENLLFKRPVGVISK